MVYSFPTQRNDQVRKNFSFCKIHEWCVQHYCILYNFLEQITVKEKEMAELQRSKFLSHFSMLETVFVFHDTKLTCWEAFDISSIEVQNALWAAVGVKLKVMSEAINHPSTIHWRFSLVFCSAKFRTLETQ